MLYVKVLLFNPIRENTYLVHDVDGNCAVIDPGCYSAAEREELSGFLEGEGLRPVILLNTHCHLDHVFGNRFVAERFGLSLHLHPLERPVLAFAPASGLMWDLPFENYEGELVDLHPGVPVCIGGERLEVLFTPGHSPGSVSFHSPSDGFVISGDVLFREGVGRTDLPGGDFRVLSDSIRHVLFSLPDETVVYSGHGMPTDIGWERRNNPYLSVIR